MIKLEFEQLMVIYNNIGEEEKHFNRLEMEYRKLASQWLLASLGAIGFIVSKDSIPIDKWVIVISICLASSAGILVLWLIDLRVYHELLHSAFREGVKLEKEYPEILPQIRNNMIDSQIGGDILKRVILYYFFSVLLLIFIANTAVWIMDNQIWINLLANAFSSAAIIIIYKAMNSKTFRKF